MTNRAATYIDYATSPRSEQSEYFDAPMMIWNKKSNGAFPASSDAPARPSQENLPGAFIGETDDGADLTRKPSVGIPRDPVIRTSPSDSDESAEDTNNEDHTPRSPIKGTHRRSGSVAMTDSGYGSPEHAPRTQSRASEGRTSIQPIPILWIDSPHTQTQRALADGDGDDEHGTGRRESPFKRAASLRSFRSAGPRASVGDREERQSVRTTPDGAGRASAMRRRRVSLSGGSFASGAGTVGPASSVGLNDAFHARSRSADLALTEKQKAKLNKTEIKEGKKVVKVIKAEGKAEKQALNEAFAELTDLQKLQKFAVKAEHKSYVSYSKALREFHKVELEFFAARAKYERAQADLQAQEDARDASRSHAQETTEMLQAKNREVEWLRAQKAVDDREREAKVRQLTGKA